MYTITRRMDHHQQQFLRNCKIGRYETDPSYYTDIPPFIIERGVMHAIRGGHQDTVQFLMDRNHVYTDIAIQNAIQYDRINIIKYILNYADLSYVNWATCMAATLSCRHDVRLKICMLILDKIEQIKPDFVNWNGALIHMCNGNMHEVVLRILGMCGDHEIDWNIALHTACRSYKTSFALVQLLIDKGANDYYLPLCSMIIGEASREIAKIIKFLYERGGNLKIDDLTPNHVVYLLNEGMSFEIMASSCTNGLRATFTELAGIRKSQYTVVDHILQMPHEVSRIIVDYIPYFL